ncbi:hypothetical protein F7P74_02235 [Helicobacter pullorum NCTC 12824]|uniref:hypothetical protein n=1 Tax=Helicobacter pullorum TaxID=35818 RepID=UPI00124888FA|nr:hypothetical protein [Helicobacter pullorum]KAB0575393.1 hypothetical protein F7P74_02235 [Helicobacter pullorum NCTC 12824]
MNLESKKILESSPKLDSKTSQKSNKESESKQPKKIQKAKSTCDSKQSKKSTKSKNSSKIKSFIRTIPISIALASALSSQAVADWTGKGIAGCTNGDGQCITGNVTMSIFDEIWSRGSATNLTISSGVTINKTASGGSGSGKNSLIYIEEQAGTITNNGIIDLYFPGVISGTFRIENSGSLAALNNMGSIKGSNIVFYIRAGGQIGTIINSGTINGSNDKRGIFEIEGNSQIGGITLTGNGVISHDYSKDVFRLSGQSQIGNITLNDNSSIRGNFNLSNSATIGTITIGGNSTGGSGNNASLTGNISLNNSSRISKILIDGSNMGGSGANGTPKLDGDITLNTSQGITNGITIANGGTLDGNINARNSSRIGGIAINNGSLIGSISLTHTSNITGGINVQNGTITNNISAVGGARIDSINITNGRVGGNISANWDLAGNGIGTINQITITGGEVGGNIELANKNTITNGMTLNNGTINGAINLNIGTADDSVASIPTISLQNASTIANITLGNSANNGSQGRIDSLTLGGTSSIGSIVNNRGTISTLTLGGTSSIGTIANSATIANLNLSEKGTITNGITNAVEGNIGTITSNTNNINNTITNSGTINELVVSKGTITYIDSNNSGVVDTLLQVEDGATLKMGANGDETITIGSDFGSVLDLKQGSTFEGNLRNASAIKEWKNESNIRGSFINASGASVGVLIAGEIRDNLLNEGNITNLIINKNIGTLTNDSNGIINTLTIQNGSNIASGIRNNSNIGSLNLQENVTYNGSGSITNALDIAGSKTLNASTNGINILFNDDATGTINNAGIISGNLNNQKGSTIKTFNTGSISGSIENSGSIVNLTATGNVNGITNAQGKIDTLTINSGASLGTGGITNNADIGTLSVGANANYIGDSGSISELLKVTGATTQFTIGGTNNTLTLGGTGNGSVKAIENAGTIIGNLTNATTTDWIGGTLQGNLTNEATATLNSLSTSAVTGSIDNKGKIGALVVDSDKAITDAGSLTESLTIEKNPNGAGYTLTINDSTAGAGGQTGTGTLKVDFTSGADANTIENAGMIAGNIANLDGSTIKIFNTGSISGSIENSGSIVNLTATGNVNGITNAQGKIDTLTINSGVSVANGITNEADIGTLSVGANVNYIGDSGSISKLLEIKGNTTRFTIGGNQTLTLGGTGAGSVADISNEGIIIGNLVNQKELDSWIGGTLQGNFTNESGAKLGNLGDTNNAGTITGNLINSGSIVSLNSGTIQGGGGLTNNQSGVIGSLHSSVVGNISNAGAIKNFVVDSDVDYTGDGNITESLTIASGGVLGAGNAGTGTITTNFADGSKNSVLIETGGKLEGSLHNVSGSEMSGFTIENQGEVTGNITNAGLIGNFLNQGTIGGNVTNQTGATINSFINSGTIEGTFTNENNAVIGKLENQANGVIADFANNGTIGIFENNGEIKKFSGTGGIIYGFVNNELVSGDFGEDIAALDNRGTITGQVNLQGVCTDKDSCLDSEMPSFIFNSGTIGTNGATGANGILNNNHTLSAIHNSGIIYGGITNKSGSIESIHNKVESNGTANIGTIDGGITNNDKMGNITNDGVIDGAITNNANASIGNIANSGTISGDISNAAGASIGSVTNSGTLAGISNEASIGKIENSGVIQGGITNTGSITTLNTGSITGSIANSGNVGALAVTGNVGGITHTAGNIGSLTIGKGVSVTNGITNNATIGDFTNSANIAYSGTGSITGDFTNNQNSTITLKDTLNLNGKGNAFVNSGILNGVVSNVGTLASLNNTGSITTLNSGSITGLLSNGDSGIINNLVVNGAVAGLRNTGNIGDLKVNGNIVEGILNGDSSHKQATIGDLNIQASLGDNGLQNAGTITSLVNNFAGTKLNNAGNIGTLDVQKNLIYGGVGSISNSLKVASGITLDANNAAIHFTANSGSVENQGNINGILSLTGSNNAITNAGVITGLTNSQAGNTLTNAGIINALRVEKNLNYSGAGSISDSAIIAENAILDNTSALIFAGNSIAGLENRGTIRGNVTNQGNMQSLINHGVMEGGITNSGKLENFANHKGAHTGDFVNVDSITKFVNNGAMANVTNQSSGVITSFLNNGTISGVVTNEKAGNNEGTIANFANTGSIGSLQNDGHIATLQNTGSIGTISNTSKNTIIALGNGEGATIEAVNNTGNINIITNEGTINGQITSQSGSVIEKIHIGANGVVNAKGQLDSSNMEDKANDAISLDTINTTLIHNDGTISGNVRVVGDKSEIGELNNYKTINGCIILDGGNIGAINNSGGIVSCMRFSNNATTEVNNSGEVQGGITNDGGKVTIDNAGNGNLGGVITSGGGETHLSNEGGNVGLIKNDGDNSHTYVDKWTSIIQGNKDTYVSVDSDSLNPENIHFAQDSIQVDGVKTNETNNYRDYIIDENGDPMYDDGSKDKEIFDALVFDDIVQAVDNGDGTYSTGVNVSELSGKTLGASLIYSARIRQISVSNILREVNVKNFKTDFEILEQKQRQRALVESYRQAKEVYLSKLTDKPSEGRVDSKKSNAENPSTKATNAKVSKQPSLENMPYNSVEVAEYYEDLAVQGLDLQEQGSDFYSHNDLLRELDDIFVNHKGGDNIFNFVLPYTRYSSVGLEEGRGTLKSHTNGVIAGIQSKLPNENGILGAYFGYESADKSVGLQRLDFDDKVYYGGLTYYQVLARKGVSEYYLSANTRLDFTQTDIYKTYKSGNFVIKSELDSYDYGADIKLGANYYNIFNNSVISPEIGVSYQGISTESFSLLHRSGTKEHYFAQDVNFFDVSVALRWQRAWNNVFKTMASVGGLYNVYDDAKGTASVEGTKITEEIDVERLYGTAQVGISYGLGENANISLNYNGIFADRIQSHSGYIRLGVWW